MTDTWRVLSPYEVVTLGGRQALLSLRPPCASTGISNPPNAAASSLTALQPVVPGVQKARQRLVAFCQKHPHVSAESYGRRGVATMLQMGLSQGFEPLGRPWSRAPAAVHPTAAVRHRRPSTGHPATRPRATAGPARRISPAVAISQENGCSVKLHGVFPQFGNSPHPPCSPAPRRPGRPR